MDQKKKNLKTLAIERVETKTLRQSSLFSSFNPLQKHHAIALWDHLVAAH